MEGRARVDEVAARVRLWQRAQRLPPCLPQRQHQTAEGDAAAARVAAVGAAGKAALSERPGGGYDRCRSAPE